MVKKAAMDPPEGGPVHYYNLGDAGKPRHMAAFLSADDNLLAVARLKPNDHCFVLRSGGIFTFAKVLSRQHNGPEALMEFQVNYIGYTKAIPMKHCANYVRPVLSLSMVRQRLPSPHQHQRDAPQSQRRRSEPPAPVSPSARGEAQARIVVPQRDLQRRSQVNGAVQSDVNINNSRQPRPSLRRAQSDIHASFQSDLNKTKLRLACGRRSSLDDGTREHHQQSQRSSLNKRPILPQGSSITANMRSSIITMNVPEDSPDDDSFELSSSVQSDSNDDSTTVDSLPSDDEDSRRSKSPRTPIEQQQNLRDSIKKVHLPGFDDSIEFNEESLLAAFNSIGGNMLT